METTPHTMQVQELQNHLRCAFHPSTFCFKPYEGCIAKDHIQIDPPALHDWASAILLDPIKNNIYNLPRSQEFTGMIAKVQRRSTATPIPVQQPIQLVMPRSRSFSGSGYSRSRSRSRSPGYSRSHYSRTPHTPAKSRHGDPVLEDMFSSPLVHHDSWDAYNGDGLKAFVTWCEGEYKIKGVEFAVAYQALKDQEISVDILKGKDPAWYTRMGVKVGTAERLVRSYPKWHARLVKG